MTSTWRNGLPPKTNTAMVTDQLEMISVGCQSIKRSVIGTQTEDNAANAKIPKKAAGLSDFVARYVDSACPCFIVHGCMDQFNPWHLAPWHQFLIYIQPAILHSI